METIRKNTTFKHKIKNKLSVRYKPNIQTLNLFKIVQQHYETIG